MTDKRDEILDHLCYIREALDRLSLAFDEIIIHVTGMNSHLEAALKNIQAQSQLRN